MVSRNRVTTCALVWILALASAAMGQSKPVAIAPGLADISIDVPAGADVSWEARDPLTFAFKTYMTTDGKSVACFYLPRGQAVMVSDVIDWDNRSRTKTTWVITIDGDEPEPEPDPDPEPDPEPDPDLSPVGKTVFDIAATINDPHAAREIANNYEIVASKMAAVSTMTVPEAIADLTALNRKVKLTKSWSSFVNTMGAWQNKYVQTRAAVISTFPDIAAGLRASAK